MKSKSNNNTAKEEEFAEMCDNYKPKSKLSSMKMNSKKKSAFFNALPVKSLARKILLENSEDAELYIYDFINAGAIAGAFDKNIMKNAYTIGHLLLKSKRDKEMHENELLRRRTINSNFTTYEKNFFIYTLVFGYSDSRKNKAISRLFHSILRQYLKSDDIIYGYSVEGISLKYLCKFYGNNPTFITDNSICLPQKYEKQDCKRIITLYKTCLWKINKVCELYFRIRKGKAFLSLSQKAREFRKNKHASSLEKLTLEEYYGEDTTSQYF